MAVWQAINRAWVTERHEVEVNGDIEPCGDRRRGWSYDPWLYRELPTELAAVFPGDSESALVFVSRWGITGQSLDATQLEPVSEPIQWLVGHAAIMRFALELINLIHRGSPAAVNHWLLTNWSEIEDSPVLLQEQRVALNNALASENDFVAGHSVLAALISYRITGVHPHFLLTPDGIPIRVYQATRLWEVIYCHLADAWEGKTSYYQCANRYCTKWWPMDGERRGPRQKYCPPEPGTNQSQCSGRERYYRRLERRR